MGEDIPITREMIRLVPCPRCGAKPRRFCAGRTKTNHQERLEYAQRLGGESLRAMESKVVDEDALPGLWA